MMQSGYIKLLDVRGYMVAFKKYSNIYDRRGKINKWLKTYKNVKFIIQIYPNCETQDNFKGEVSISFEFDNCSYCQTLKYTSRENRNNIIKTVMDSNGYDKTYYIDINPYL